MSHFPRTGILCGLAVAGLAGALMFGASDSIQARQSVKQASKVAALVLDRIDRVNTLRSAAGLTASSAATLSSEVLPVSALGELEVEFHARGRVGEAEVADLARFGATVLASTGDAPWPAGVPMPADLGILTVRMPAGNVVDASALDWVVAVTPAERHPPDVGAFASEGATLHNATTANSLGITGFGVTIGAISDGVASIGAAQALGDLPLSVNVLDAGGGDEGTAMLEIIHDLAPGASLAFHGTGGGTGNHINALFNLAAAGANVIAEDIPFDGEPAFQKGAVATAGEALAVAGISLHSSAGNMGGRHTARVAATGTGGGPDGVGAFAGCTLNPTNVVAIAPGNDTTFDVQVGMGATLSATLQWSEPRAIFPTPGLGGFTDLDLYVMDASSGTCLAESLGLQANGVGDTLEQVSWNNGGGTAVNVKLVVNVSGTSSAVAAPLLDLRFRGAGAVDAPTRAGSMNPDSNYTFGATSAGAVNASGSTDPTTVGLEGFSSGGPVQLITTTVCPGGMAPPCIGVAGGPGQTAGAPTWTAADGVSVTGAGGFGAGNCPAVTQGDCRFFGTSAAAPHAAAVAALVVEALGGSPTPLEVHQVMANTATDRDTPGFDNNWGWGVLNALAASGEEADLEVTKDCKPDDPVDAGAVATCTVYVDNHGGSVAREVELTDTHIADGTFSIVGTTASQGSCAVSGGVVTCQLGDIPAGGPGVSGRVTVTVDVTADEGMNINDEAFAVSDTFDPDLSNNSDSDTVSVRPVADLNVGKSDSPDPVVAGQMLTYSLTFGNAGPSTATGVTVSDFLPAGVSIVSVSGSGAASCAAGVPGDPSRPTECHFGNVGDGGGGSMTVVVQVGADVTGTLSNDASVFSEVYDPNGEDNVANEITTVGGEADLAIVKEASPEPVLAGRMLTYALEVSNAGPSHAAGVVVTDMLPDEVDFVSATFANGTGTCELVDVNPAPPSKMLNCQLGAMGLNTASPLVIFVNTRVTSGTADGAVIMNTATVVSSTLDPNGANDTDSASSTVINNADLEIVMTSDQDTYKASSIVIYEVTVTNHGPSDAMNVVVTDALPDVKQLSYVFDTAGCAVSGLSVTCDLGTLAAGASRTFNLHVEVKGNKGLITNTAMVASTTVDPNAANNSSTRSVIVGK